MGLPMKVKEALRALMKICNPILAKELIDCASLACAKSPRRGGHAADCIRNNNYGFILGSSFITMSMVEHTNQLGFNKHAKIEITLFLQLTSNHDKNSFHSQNGETDMHLESQLLSQPSYLELLWPHDNLDRHADF